MDHAGFAGIQLPRPKKEPRLPMAALALECRA